MKRTENKAERLHDKEVKIKRQSEIHKRIGLEVDSYHRYHKRRAMDCGNPGCFLCGNRRQHEGETVQESSFWQTESWKD